MAENTIDTLSLEIVSSANGADKALDKLANSLLRLQSSLGGGNFGQFANIANGIRQMSDAMERFTGAIKTADFTRIVTGLNKLGTVNVQGVSDASRAISALTSNLSQIGTIAFDSQGIANIANAIAQLGRKTVTQAASNIPLLTTALSGLINGLNGLQTITFDMTGLSELVSAISRLGGKAATNAIPNIQNLGVALRGLMTTLSTAPNVSQNVIQMAQALAQLASNGSRVSSASRGLIAGINGIGTASAKAKGHTLSLAGAIGKFYATYWLLIRGMGMFKKAIDISSDLTEVQNVVDVTFGHMSDKIEEFANTSLQNYGMSELMAKQIASRFQAMGVAMGFAQDHMSDMSIELTKLAGDMASFYNESQESVAKSLQSVFTGETEPLRRFGLDLTNATIQAWALSQGMDANVSKMTQAEKTMLRYQYVLANTGAASGDFLRTINSWHNQLVLLSGAFQQLGSIVGGVLINAFKPFVQALNSVMSAVINFAQVVSDALGAIFGWEYQTGGGVAQDLELGASAAEDIEDATGGAAKKAKEMNKYIAAWHEVNNMTTSDDSDGGGGGGGAGGAAGGGAANGGEWKQTESMWEKYKSDIDSLYNLGKYISDALTSAMNSINWESVYEGARNFGSGLASFLNGLISPELFGAVGQTIAGALNTAIYAALAFGETFDWTNLGESIASGVNNFFATFDFAALANTIDTWVQGIWTTVRTALVNIDWKNIFAGIWDFAKNLDLETIGIIVGAITIKQIGKTIVAANVLKSIGSFIGGKISGAIIKGLSFEGIGSFLARAFPSSTIIQTITTTMAETGASLPSVLWSTIWIPIQTFFTATLPTAITGAFASVGSIFGLSGSAAIVAGGGIIVAAAVAAVAAIVAAVTHWDEIKDFFGKTIPAWWNGTALPFFKNIPENLLGIWELVKTSASQKWEEFLNVMSGIPGRVSTIIQNIAKWFNDLPGKIGYALAYALGTVTKWGVELYQYLAKKIPEIIASVVKWFSEMPNKIYNGIVSFISLATTWGTNVFNTFKTKTTEIIDNVVKWFSEMPKKIYDTIIKIKDKITEWGSQAISFFQTEVPKIVDKVIEFFGDLPKKIVDVGKNLVTGLWDGINEKFRWLKDKIGGFVDDVIQGFKDGFDEHSPSKIAFEIGDFFTQGLGNGIVDRFGDIYKDIDSFTGDIATIKMDVPKLDLSVSKPDFSAKSYNLGAFQSTMQMEMDAKMAEMSFQSQQLRDIMEKNNAILQQIKAQGIILDDNEFNRRYKSGAQKYYKQTGRQLGIDY